MSHPFAKDVTINGVTRQVIFCTQSHTVGDMLTITLHSNLYPMHGTISAEWELEAEGDLAPTAKAVYTPSESIFKNTWCLGDSELAEAKTIGENG